MTAPFQPHSATSREAAESVEPHLRPMQDKVLEAIKQAPSTDQEIAAATGMAENSVRPRRIELYRLGLIVSFGTKRTSSGRRATVWVIPGHVYGMSSRQGIEHHDPFALRPCVVCGEMGHGRYCSNTCAIAEDGEPEEAA